ncbi:MAG: sulfurtransferase complex subunit TusB [Rhodospirillales bacterium]|nr:sulfurtransferase complex subunit TusB [Rhodospirillales bacterium]
MALLHTVNKSPFERNVLSDCLRRAKDGSAVLLIEDGVYAALEGTSATDEILSRTGSINFFALAPDIEARGLGKKPLIDGITLVDYGGFVDLVEEYSSVQSWL